MGPDELHAGAAEDLEEAAYIDGATPLQVFYRVMLPLVAPGLVTAGLLAFIAAWKEFLYALSFTATPDKHTVTVAITTFTRQDGQRVPDSRGARSWRPPLS